MLVLSRKEQQSIRIGDDVLVTILQVNHRQVKIGITAPKSISVNREEVYQKMQQTDKIEERHEV